MKNKGLPYVLLLSTFFGSSLISSRFALGEFKSLQFISLRMLISTICFIITFTLTSKFEWPRGSNLWRHGLILGIIGTTIPMTAFISSLNYLSSGVAATMGAAGPALTVVLAHFMLADERLNLQKVIGVLLALSGALLLALRGETGLGDGASSLTGYLLIGTSTLSSSFGVIYARTYVKDLSAFQITSIRVLTCTVITLPIAYYLYGFDMSDITRVGYTALFYSAIISSFMGFILSLYIINNFGVATSIQTNYVTPIVATIGGILLLDEQITIGMLAGMLVISLGVYTINAKHGRPYRVRPRV